MSNRRNFLKRSGALIPALWMPLSSKLLAEETEPAGWRTYEVTTHVEIRNPAGVTRVWIPEPLIRETPFQKTLGNEIKCEEGKVTRFRDKQQGMGIINAVFPAGTKPAITVTSSAKLRDWTVDVATGNKRPDLSSSERIQYLRSTKMVPTDGIVKQRAIEITRNAGSEMEKARAIYAWIVENTYRSPKVRGCGRGDIGKMLESGELSGKCADLNGLYVGLARAAGLPAREVFGIRVAKSQLGYRSLGTSSENVTKAQHCRAEVYVTGYGWLPVDPADVRKVMLEEPPGPRTLEDEKVKAIRARLFGAWEMNWMAYNFAQDVALPGAAGPPVHFFMYPEAETQDGRLDCLDPDTFCYSITTRTVAEPT
ncbi:MAG: transglutaminase domain-containing protein [Acidobacteriaceae bacterium]|nr:transglutaminase domain-containing protein [Acidobacteriaceae bacterium]